MTPVLLVWRDAYAYRERWLAAEDIDPEPCIVESFGWLLEGAKPEHAVLAQSRNSDGDLDGLLCVPLAMVVSIEIFSAEAHSS